MSYLSPLPVPELSYEVLDRPGPQNRLLVLVHGYAEPPANLTDRIDLIDPDGVFRTVVPEGPFEHRGTRIWHRAVNTAPELAAQQYVASHTALDRLLGHLSDELGLAVDEGVVGGFSQGGGLSMSLLLGADVANRPAAAFGVCSFPPAFPGFRIDAAAARSHPFWLRGSRNDRFAEIELVRGAAAVARELLQLTYRETDDEHVVTDADAIEIGRWLPRALAGQTGDDAAALDDVEDRLDIYRELWEFVS